MKNVRSFIETLNHPRTVWALLVFAGVLSIMYLYFVSVTVLSAAHRESTHKKVITLRENVVGLEETFLKETAKITMSRAENAGFEVMPASRISFITSTGGTVLTYNTSSR